MTRKTKTQVRGGKKTVRAAPQGRRRATPLPSNTEKAEAVGAQYARDQIGSDYFMDWVHEQMLEASQADPSQQLPLETKEDAQVIAKNMLQQLTWDAQRGLDQMTILEMVGPRSDPIGNFWIGFKGALRAPYTIDWLADELLTIKSEMSGGSVSEDRRRAPKRLRYSDEQVRAMLAQVPMYREQLLAAAKERGWDRPSVVPITEVHAFLRAQLAASGGSVGEARRGVVQAPRRRSSSSQKYKPSKNWRLHVVDRIVPSHGAQRVEFNDGLSIQVHGGSGRDDLLYAMRPVDMRFEQRSPGPESRREYQYAALKAVLGDRPADFVVDHDGDVRAILTNVVREGVVRAFTKSQHHFTNGSNQIENGINVWVSGDEPTRVTISGRDRESAERIVRSWWGSQALHFAWTDSTHADIGRDYTKFTRESGRRSPKAVGSVRRRRSVRSNRKIMTPEEISAAANALPGRHPRLKPTDGKTNLLGWLADVDPNGEWERYLEGDYDDDDEPLEVDDLWAEIWSITEAAQ